MLTDYYNTNQDNDIAICKSMTEYLFYLCGDLISWSSKWQAALALSSMEAEYMVLTYIIKEAT